MRKAIVAAAALTVTACGGYKPSRVDSALAALVPPDTVMLAGARLEELRATPLYQKLAARQSTAALDEFARDTGLDLRKDVSEILVASNGAGTAVLARGAFQSLTPRKGRKSAYKGATLYSQDDGAYAVLDPRTAVAGPEAAIRRVLDQREARSRGADALLRRVDTLPIQGQLWIILNRPADTLKALPQRGNLANLNRAFRLVDSATLAADLRNGLIAHAGGECRTPEDAKLLGDALRGFLGLARLGVQPRHLKLFDGIKVGQENTSVRLEIAVPFEMVDELLKLGGVF